MPKKRDRYYSERASPFFRLKSRAKLADLLFISRTKLRTLACAEDLYVHFRKPKRSGGSREICAPREDLKAVQSRIATLLQRIVPPDYLFAPRNLSTTLRHRRLGFTEQAVGSQPRPAG